MGRSYLLGLVHSLIVVLLLNSPALAQFEIEHPNGKLSIEGRLRFGYNQKSNFDNDTDYSNNSFFLDQVRLELEGDIYEDFEYEISVEFRNHDGEFKAKDLFFSYQPRSELTLRLGQFKVPYSRKRLLSSSKTSTIERPAVSQDFVPGRDRGVALRLRTINEKYAIHTGIFSGNGENIDDNDTKGNFLYVVRVECQPLGILPDEEGDYLFFSGLRFLVGANITYSKDDGLPDKHPEYLRTTEGNKTLYGGDISFRFRGWFLTAEFNHAKLQPDRGEDFKAGGYLVQGSYFIRPLKIEPVIAYDEFNPNNKIENITERSITYGLNYSPYGHNIKIMANYYHRLKKWAGAKNPWKENEFRAIMQLVFK